MNANTNEQSNSRFSGDEGRSKAIAVLRKNTLVANDEALANEIFDLSDGKEFPQGAPLISQGNDDDDVYFLLSGQVEVRVTGKSRIVVRQAPIQVGEMAALNATDTRSATVVAKDGPVSSLKLSAHNFNELRKRYPRFSENALIEQNDRNKAWKASDTEAPWFLGLITSRTLALCCSILATLLLAILVAGSVSPWLAAIGFLLIAAVLFFLSSWLNRTRLLFGTAISTAASTVTYITNPFTLSFSIEGGWVHLAVDTQKEANFPALLTLLCITVIFLTAGFISQEK